MRLATLAEIPEQWSQQVHQWRAILARQAQALADPGLEYFFYQTLLGSYPASDIPSGEYRQRLQGAMVKAAREARRHTSWGRPNEDYESRLIALIDAALDSPGFMEAFRPFQQRIARAGAANSLVQTLLKLTVPGVPDVYQGAELWDLSLVDPDNRRPVDYPLRTAMLDRLLDDWQRDPRGTVREAATHWQDGRIKLLVTALALRLRESHDALSGGEYLPCQVRGGEGFMGAFLRRSARGAVLVVFRRLPFARPLDEAAESLHVELPSSQGTWRDVLQREDARPQEQLTLPAGLPIGLFARDSL
jgi:(1->4)-alpha-D-glucan 1-alpha-D-glucosylmutase